MGYLIREEINLLPEADDPPTKFSTIEDEMIARALIESAPGILTGTSKVDNKSLWDKLVDLLRDTKAWVHIKAHQRACDGRGAYLSLKDFYHGPNMVNELASGAEVYITKDRYTGETKRGTFDLYVAVQKAQHQILSDLIEHG